MKGTEGYGNIINRAQIALEAGCDMILVCNDALSCDRLLDELKWDMPALSLARLARMHGRSHSTSLIKLHENANFVSAVNEIDQIGKDNLELSFS